MVSGRRGKSDLTYLSPSKHTLILRALLPAILFSVVAIGTAYSMSSEKRQAILAPTMSFENAEKWGSLPGGSATNRKRFDREAFSQPAESLSFEERSTFFVGNGLFRRLWITAPASTKSSDGLGPLFNARALSIGRSICRCRR